LVQQDAFELFVGEWFDFSHEDEERWLGFDLLIAKVELGLWLIG
jgi:hypothetical protein